MNEENRKAVMTVNGKRRNMTVRSAPIPDIRTGQ